MIVDEKRCIVCGRTTNLEEYVCDECIPVRNHIVKHKLRE